MTAIAEPHRRRLSLPMWAIHPLLFAAYPVLFLFAANIREQVTIDIIFGPLAVVLATTVIALAVHWLLVRDPVRAGLLTSLAVVLFFSYGHAWNALAEVVGLPRYLLAGWTVLAVLGIVLAARLSDAGARALTAGLTVGGAALVIINLVPIVDFALRPAAGTNASPAVVEPGVDTPAHRPDIYYLVFDRYAAQSTLEQMYGFDNSPFLDALERRGFYVAERSHANYLKTTMSLIGTFEMDYLEIDALAEQATAPDDFAPILRRLGGPMEVTTALRAQGYQYVHLGTWYQPTATNSAADLVLRYGALSEFSSVLYDSTLLPVLRGASAAGESSEFRESYRRHALYQFDRLSRIESMAGPKLVFAHVSLPHPPYVFDAEGNPVTASEQRARSESRNYVEQLTYTNTRILDLLDRLLDAPAGAEPVILLQADEGPYPVVFERDQEAFDWHQATPDQLLQKFAILNAYHLPGADASQLYPSISPVNSFRVVFNAYFGTDLELLPDRSYAWNAHDVYSLIDVTPRLPDPSEADAPDAPVAVSFDADPPPTWIAGAERTYAVTLTNDGGDTWPAAVADRVRLSVQFGPEADAPPQDWLAERRFELPRDVPPGESVTLEVTMPAPEDPGEWVLRHRLVRGELAWGSATADASVAVIPPAESLHPPYAASYAADPPRSWATGETTTYDVTVTNRGTATWPYSGAERVRLSAHFGTDDDQPGAEWLNEVRFELPRDVEPGESVEIRVTLTAPRTEGAYVLRHRLVAEGVTWFDDIDRTKVTVATPAWLVIARPTLAIASWLAAIAVAWLAIGPWARRPGRATPRWFRRAGAWGP